MKVISLGWGVQSFTLAAMSAFGDLPSIDAAIHANTTHERSATYEFAARLTPWLEERGVRVVTVANTTAQITTDRPGGEIWIPSYTADTVSGTFGQLRRQCTHRWKVNPMRRWLQANRHGEPVEQWLGISMDEWQRARDSDRKYITNRYPLLDLRMTRADCVKYLESHGLEVPHKSACVFCPYHDMRAWQEMKRENGADWQKAVEVDRAIRKARPPYDLFIHRAMMPLEAVDLRTAEERGQMALWQETCESGYCWT